MYIHLLVRRSFLRNVKELNLTPVLIDVTQIKHDSKLVLDHHDYPTDKPIVLQKYPDSELYDIRDGTHRYQQAIDLGSTQILSVIAPYPMPD